MAYVITDECVHVEYVKQNAPEAISAGDDIYVIDETCIDCGACADVCPVDALNLLNTRQYTKIDSCFEECELLTN